MSLIMGQIKSENWELLAHEFGKVAESDFVYTPASANIDQPVPNLATIYMPIKSQMSSILFTLQHLQILTNQHQTSSKCM